MEPLAIRHGWNIPPEFLSVSFTRTLDGEDDAAVAARHTPSVVELRFDTRACPGLDPQMRAKIVAHPELRADRRGTVRVRCGEHRSRAQNVEGARRRLRELLIEALHPTSAEPAPAPRKKRRHAGLIKGERSPQTTD